MSSGLQHNKRDVSGSKAHGALSELVREREREKEKEKEKGLARLLLTYMCVYTIQMKMGVFIHSSE